MCYPLLVSGSSTQYKRTMVVHINRLQHRYVRQGEKSEEVMQDWEPPGIEHFIVPTYPANILSMLLIKWKILMHRGATHKGLEDPPDHY